MKTLFAFLAAAGLAGAAFAAENWTRDQQEIAGVFQAWAKAEKAGDVDRLMSLTAPAFTGWDFAASRPMDRSAFQKAAAEFFRGSRVIECAVKVISIDIQGSTAIAYSRYTETMQTAPGMASTVQGSWSTTLIRGRGGWLVLSQSWIADRPEADETAVRQDVDQAMKDFTAAVERLDLAGALKFRADVPEFSYADTDGKLYDYAAAKNIMTETFAGCATLKTFKQRQEISMLGPDAALVDWNGAIEFTQKDGTVLRVDPYTIAFLFKRLNGSWKIVHQHESALPPQPVKSATVPAPAATSTTEILRMLDEYFAAVNARDPVKFLGFFVDTEDLTVFEDKESSLSRREFAAFVDSFFKGVSRIQATWESRAVYPLAPNVAVVTGAFKVEANDTQGAPLAVHNAFTFVLVKQGDRWLVKHVHESSLDLSPGDTGGANKQLVTAAFAAMDRADYRSFRGLVSEDAVIRIIGAPEPLKREALIAFLQDYWKAFPDTTHTIHEILAEGETVVVHVTCQGTQAGTYEGVAATGKLIRYEGVHIVRFQQGRIREWWVLDDSLGLMQQLGLQLAPASGNAAGTAK